MACSKAAPVVPGDVVGDTVSKAVNLDAVSQTVTSCGGIVLDREHSAYANIAHAQDDSIAFGRSHIREGIPGNSDVSVAGSARQIIHHRADRMPLQTGEGAARNGDIRHTIGKHSSCLLYTSDAADEG